MIILQCSLPEKQIKSEMRKIVFGNRTRCPTCHNLKIKSINHRYWCPRCRKFFSLTSTTWLKNIRFAWQKLYLLLYCWLKEYPVRITLDLTELSRPTIYQWNDKFRNNIPLETIYLSEEVEVDESWFGTRNKGRKNHTWKENKIPVVGIYARESDKLITKSLPAATAEYILPFIKGNVDQTNAKIFSDKYRPYWPLRRLGLNHTMVDHYSGEYTETNRIEGMWSVMKRRLKRTYYAVSKRKFPKYVCEITYRINTRKNPEKPLEYLNKSIMSAS